VIEFCYRIIKLLVDPVNDLLIETMFLSSSRCNPLTQWCTTSGPRATSGPRQVLMRPATSIKKSDYFIAVYSESYNWQPFSTWRR